MLLLRTHRLKLLNFVSTVVRLKRQDDKIWACNSRFYTDGYPYSKNEIFHDEPSQSALQDIKSISSPTHLFETLAKTQGKLNQEEVVEIFKMLFNFQRCGNSMIEASEIIKHPQFEHLCRNLKTVSRSFDTNTIIDVLKILSYIGVSSKTEIVHVLLNLLRRQINDVTLCQITFLEFLLKKFDHSPLIEALQLALPMVFQIQLSTQIDHENVAELVDLLAFASRNDLSDPCTMSIVTALTLHGSELRVDEAKSIVWSLCDLPHFKPQYEKLLKNAITVIVNNFKELPYEALESTITKLIEQHVHVSEVFYDERIFNVIPSRAIEQDVGFIKACYLLRKFNKINFVSIELLDYITEKILENPKSVINARPNTYFTTVTAFSTANYLPKQWNIIKMFIMQNPIMTSDKSGLPWMKFNMELMSLDCYNEKLLEKVFANEFLERYLARERNFLDYLQFLSLYQSVMILHSDYSGKLPNQSFVGKAMELNLIREKFPIKPALEQIFGGERFVLTKLKTKFGHFISHAIVFNENDEPVDVTDKQNGTVLEIENLFSDKHKVVAILSLPKSYYAINVNRLKGIFDLQVKTMVAMGLPIVALNYSHWNRMPDQEKFQYLENEIRNKLKDPPSVVEAKC